MPTRRYLQALLSKCVQQYDYCSSSGGVCFIAGTRLSGPEVRVCSGTQRQQRWPSRTRHMPTEPPENGHHPRRWIGVSLIKPRGFRLHLTDPFVCVCSCAGLPSGLRQDPGKILIHLAVIYSLLPGGGRNLYLLYSNINHNELVHHVHTLVVVRGFGASFS